MKRQQKKQKKEERKKRCGDKSARKKTLSSFLSLTSIVSFFRTCFSAAPLLGRRKDGKVAGSEDVAKRRFCLLLSFFPFFLFNLEWNCWADEFWILRSLWSVPCFHLTKAGPKFTKCQLQATTFIGRKRRCFSLLGFRFSDLTGISDFLYHAQKGPGNVHMIMVSVWQVRFGPSQLI